MSIQTNRQFDLCLLIPCYNNFEGLIVSLRTVNYYPERLMIVIVDDGNKTPVTAEAINLVVKIDYPLVVLRNEVNHGITHALNTGLKWIEGNTEARYIARLDCDDLCHPERFYKQVDYMDNNSDTGLLGSWCIFRNRQSTLRYQYKAPANHEKITRAMHFRNIFIHPTVVFKTSLVTKKRYPDDFEFAEDYAFFWELIKISPAHILEEFLVTCDINEDGISLKNRRLQLVSRIRVIKKYGTNPILKIVGILGINFLRLLPKRLALQFKNLK